MKRFFKQLSAGLALFCALLICSCNFEVPEKISVKTSGTKYEFPLGNGSFLLRDKISASELRDTLKENLGEDSADISVYDYNPTQNDDDVLRYLIKYPVEEISLGLTTDGSNEMKFSTEISFSSLNSAIADKIEFGDLTCPMVELGKSYELPASDYSLGFSINTPTFSTIDIYAGTLELSVSSPDNVSSDFEMNVKLVLCDSDGNEIASTDTRDIANGTGSTPFSLDITGKSLYPHMKIKFSGNINGGKLGTTHEYVVSMKAKDFSISKVTGLTMTAEDIGDIDSDESTPDGTIGFDNSFNFTDSSGALVSATIGEGTLSLYSEVPDGWSGVNMTVSDLSVQQTDGLNLTKFAFSDFTSDSSDGMSYLFYKQADLKNLTIKPTTTDADKIALSGNVAVSFDNATIVLTDGTEDCKITVGGACAIEKMTKLIVNISSLADTSTMTGEIDTGLNFSTLLKDKLGDASNLIKNVQFSGIEAYVYAVQPGIDVLNDIGFSGCTLEATYTVDGTADSTKIVDNKEVKFKDSQIDLDSLADENYTITTDVFTTTADDGTETANYSVKTEDDSICTLINKLPDNLKINYSLDGFTSSEGTQITLYEDDFEKLQTLKSIQLYILLDVPLKITLSDTVDFPETSYSSDGKISILDVRELVRIINGEEESENKDLLSRDSSEDFEDYKKYIDLVDSFTIKYKAINTTKFGMEGSLYDAATGISKALSFDTSDTSAVDDKGYLTFELTQDEIKSVFNSYPFNPIIRIDIDANGTEKSVPRNAEIGLDGYVQIVLDGTVEVWSKNEK